jgi:hypothetical protein
VNAVATILVLLAPVALIYGWACFLTPKSGEPAGWRSRATLLSLTLVSLAVLLWFVTMLHMPGADWRTGAGVGHQVAWVYTRARAASYALLAALVVCFIGRPRLILPIAVACVGTAMFWLFSTMP